MASGCVTVQVIKARLRLVWSSQGRRFFLYIGLADTKPNRKAANIKAQTIELDIGSGNFDRSLAKYKPQAQSEAISVVEMFDRFTQQKQRTISIGPLAKYLSLPSKSFSMSIAIPVIRFQSLGMSLNFHPQHFCF
jgi:integrase